MINLSRLDLARKRRRLTSKALSEKANVAPVTLSRILRGKQEPDETTIQKLVVALDFPFEFFVQDDLDNIDASVASFRSMSGMTARERDAALSAGSLAYEISDWVDERYDLPEVDLLELGHEHHSPQTAARMLRQYWSIGEKPLGNIIKLLEAKGVRIFSLSENTKKVDAFSVWRDDQPFIFLNTFKSAERSRFDAMHELGHLVLHKHGGPVHRAAEIEANQFASSFLMPSSDVRSHIPYVTSLDQVIRAKKRWGVSAAALSYRLHKLSIVTDHQYRSFCIQLNQRFGKSEPQGMEREKSSIWQMVFKDLWKDKMTRSGIAHALNIPDSEVDSLLFGLTTDVDRPNVDIGSHLKIVE